MQYQYSGQYFNSLKNNIPKGVKLLLIIILPLMLIILQNDTGTSIVFCSLFFVLYREGISQIYLLIAFIILSISILTIKISISTAILLCLIVPLLEPSK